MDSNRYERRAFEIRYLFRLKPDCMQCLNDDNVDGRLKKEFTENKKFLSIKAKVSKIDEKQRGIVDEKKRV